MKIVIYGIQRGGTHYICRLLCRCGLDFHHEEEPEVPGDGMVSWKAINYDTIAQRDDCVFYHQVREPLATIGAIARHTNAWGPSTMEDITGRLGRHEDAFARAASLPDRSLILYVAWHERIAEKIHGLEQFRGLYQVENVNESLVTRMLSHSGRTPDERIDKALATVPKTLGSGGKPKQFQYRWETFSDQEYVEAARKMAQDFQYEGDTGDHEDASSGDSSLPLFRLPGRAATGHATSDEVQIAS